MASPARTVKSCASLTAGGPTTAERLMMSWCGPSARTGGGAVSLLASIQSPLAKPSGVLESACYSCSSPEPRARVIRARVIRARVVRARVVRALVGPRAGVEGAHPEMWITPWRAQGPYPESLNFQPPG